MLMVDWKNGPVDPDINAVSTGNYGLLSVELCRLTGDMKYCDRAYETARWLDDHMVKPDGLLMDHYNAADCGLKDWTFTCEYKSSNTSSRKITPDCALLFALSLVISPKTRPQRVLPNELPRQP